MALPGIDLPLHQTSDLPVEGSDGNWHERAIALTVRERVMLDVMATIKNKRKWEKKVFDEAIVRKWRSQVCKTGDSWYVKDKKQTGEFEGLAPKGARRQRGITKGMFEYCFAELRAQAPLSKARGFTEVLDANAAVYISDKAVDHDTKLALRTGAFSLENVRDGLKDWHPGSGGKVLDLVHPSLYPLIYGKSRYLPNAIVPLKDCARYSGKGDAIPSLNEDDVPYGYSSEHQWLPCEVDLDDLGNATITSYINNLHPEDHGTLYTAIQRVITKSVPMWQESLRSTLVQYDEPRIDIDDVGYDHQAAEADYAARRQERRDIWKREKKERQKNGAQKNPCDEDAASDANKRESDEEDESDSEDYEGSDYDDDVDYWDDKYIRLPEPNAYETRERKSTEGEDTKLAQMFASKKLQVIVKLANIQLTPEKSSYDGGSWHIEGLSNEHICASALYYYDSANVTDSYLAFRETVDSEHLDPRYEQHRYDSVIEIYGLYGKDHMSMSAMQVIGHVLTREDRLLVFPNVLQHRVQPFGLADRTKPGHRKILALFLVDPSIRIPSTANVPPQQKDWWAKKINEEGLLNKLPSEVADLVYDKVEEFPLGFEQAKQVRADLMAERGAYSDSVADGSLFAEHGYCFCEH